MAGQLGYCGLDRRRAPLVGDEIRACWESTPVLAVAPLPPAAPVTAAGSGTALPTQARDFIEVDQAPAPARVAAATATPVPDPDHDPADATLPAAGLSAIGAEPGWSLWGDLEA